MTMFKSRKVVLFLVTMAGCALLAFFNKDSTALVALYGVYVTGNVGTHFSHKGEK